MAQHKIICVKGKNIPPDEEVNDRIAELGAGWEVVSASTAMMPWGDMNSEELVIVPLHVYYTITVVMRKKEAPEDFVPC